MRCSKRSAYTSSTSDRGASPSARKGCARKGHRLYNDETPLRSGEGKWLLFKEAGAEEACALYGLVVTPLVYARLMA